MRKYIFWGLFLVTVGVLWLLKIAHIIHFSYLDFFSLWPLILVWVGIGLLPIKDGYKIMLDVLAYGAGLFFLLYPIEFQKKRSVLREDAVEQISTFYLNKNFEVADLELRAGASEIFFRSGKSNLIYVHSDNNERVRLNVSEGNDEDSEVQLDLEILNSGYQKYRGPYTVFLHPDPIWDINYKVGATDNSIDLSPFKIRRLQLSSGASNIDLKIGDLYDQVNVDIGMGASALSVAIPDNMNCYIENKSALSSVSFEGFTKNSTGNYSSQVLDTLSKGTIRITISSGVSDISVIRYTPVE